MSATSHTFPVGRMRSLVPNLAGRSVGSRRRRWLAAGLLSVGTVVFALLIRAHGAEFLHAIDGALHAGWKLVAAAALLEAASVTGYVVLLHRVVSRASSRLRLKDSYDITLGGAAATRLLPTAGLGGAAVTVWALRARGVRTSELTERLLAFLLLLYVVYLSALLAGGVALAFGVGSVSGGRGLGILAGGLAIAVAAVVLILFAAPSPTAKVLKRVGRRWSRAASLADRAVEAVPVFHAALRRAGQELRRPHPAMLGAVAYWAFDIGVLALMLHAFGVREPIVAVVVAYFLGTLLNLVPLPGSLSGGLAASLIALGSPVGGALAAVLAYRALAVWLPAAPGIVSLASLRRSVASWRTANGELTALSGVNSPYRSAAPQRRQLAHDFRELQTATNVAK
jgi:uncharacterized membrane protein YbhN (UPF0104 family)